MSEDIKLFLDNLQFNGDNRRFIVIRLGQTGSAWFAKLINSHPDVFCDHEGILGKIYPRHTFSLQDQCEYASWLACQLKGTTHLSVGDVGSFDLNFALNLPEEYFTVALLFRHPANQIYSHMRNSIDYPLNINDHHLKMEEFIQQYFEIDASKYDISDRLFLATSWLWYCQLVSAQKVKLVLKIEELNENKTTQSALFKLTGVEYGKNLVKNAIQTKVNSQAKQLSPQEAFDQFSMRQKEWYGIIVNKLADEMGYSLSIPRRKKNRLPGPGENL